MIALLVISQFIGIFASKEACEKALETTGESIFDYLTGNTSDLAAGLRFFYSGKTLNDLGHYSSCLKEEDSNYVFLKASDAPLMSIGLCLPKNCTDDAVQEILSSMDFQSPILNAFTDKIEVVNTDGYEIEPEVIVVVVFLCLIWLTMLVGTALDYLELGSDGKGTTILKCFSVVRNWNALTGPAIKENTCVLNGIRVFSMGWVIMGHMYLIMLAEPIANIEEIPDILGWNTSMIAYGGYFSVDTFFWLGGFLMSYLTLKQLKDKRGSGRFWGMAIFLRFLRLIPAYVFIIIVCYWILPYIGSGPMWYFTYQFKRDCAEYWWTNILFLNNFIPNGDGNGCIPHAWYLAVDMQLFLLCLLFVAIINFFKPAIAWVTMIALFASEICVRAIISEENDYSLAMISSTNLQNDLFHKIYSKPYCRSAPYLIGVMGGVIYYQYVNNIDKDKIAKKIEKLYTEYRFTGVISFFVGWGLFQAMLFLERHSYRDKYNNYKGYSTEFNAFIIGIQTVYVAVCYSLIFLPMLLGKMSFVRGILGWKGWSAAAKMTYSTYIAHMAAMGCFLPLTQEAFYWSGLSAFRLYVFCAIVSFLGGFAVYMMIEGPFGEIVKEFIKPQGKKPDKRAEEVQDVLLSEIKPSSE